MGKKLTSENGETLTELLISVLVIALDSQCLPRSSRLQEKC